MDQNLNPDAATLTKSLCQWLAAARPDDLTPAAMREARRGVLDWLGCALAGSQHAAITTLIDVLQETGSRPQATVFGRKLKLGLLDAPLANGQMGHILDYDDTHMGGVVLHTSSPVLAALFALAERRPVSGAEFALAYAVGFEAGVRCGRSAPGHHSGGWHLTGTLGSIAAGAACGKLVGLDAQRLTYAMGIAATQAAGMQQNRGTMCKSFHAGRAASNGLLAALLAQQGFDSSDEIVEGKRGFARIYSNVAAPELVLDQLGTRWEIARNGYKPYACGVVLHPILDAMVALGEQRALEPDAIARIEARVHPIAVRITGLGDPKTGLQSKFSIYHAAAVAYRDRGAGIAQFSDARAAAPDVVALRNKIVVTTDEGFRKDQAQATLVTAAGERIEANVAHASGTVDNPMSDRAIENKFLANAAPAVGDERARQIAATAWRLETLSDTRELISLCA
jgi:2-methylcitrate dehydratase PrpD